MKFVEGAALKNRLGVFHIFLVEGLLEGKGFFTAKAQRFREEVSF